VSLAHRSSWASESSLTPVLRMSFATALSFGAESCSNPGPPVHAGSRSARAAGVPGWTSSRSRMESARVVRASTAIGGRPRSRTADVRARGSMGASYPCDVQA
jgi:hypothetical protein